MKHFLLAIIITASLVVGLIGTSAASAAPPTPSGTLSGPNEAGPYAFGDSVTFSTTVTGLKGQERPMIYVECYSVVDGTLLYGQLDHADSVFVLGGGSSLWWTQRDDADCLAHLYAYGGKEKGVDTIVELAPPVAFTATG